LPRKDIEYYKNLNSNYRIMGNQLNPNQPGGGGAPKKKPRKCKLDFYLSYFLDKRIKGAKVKRKRGGANPIKKLPTVTPNTKCRLRKLKLDRIKDYLLME